jgi:predicted ATPase
VVDQFGDGAWLLILDNLERVVDAAGDLDELLARCRGVAILATSRTVLGLRAEREYPVPPLPLPADAAGVSLEELASSPAVALFVDRARAVRHDFALTKGNAPAVVELCRRLEGLPPAIELAAARTRLLDPEVLLGRLARSLDALGTGTVDLPERQRTLRATVEWSVGLLDDAERSLLETMAVFVDGWTIEAAADVAGVDEDRALALTEALVRHSLIYLESSELGPRPRMLETVREFVAERLAARPDVAEIGRRHADHYRGLAEQADRPLRGSGTASGSSACRPKRATWPPRWAGTWPTIPRRCRTCSASCGPSGSSGTIWARPVPGSTSSCPPPTPSTPRSYCGLRVLYASSAKSVGSANQSSTARHRERMPS